ncbi:hypothetical protein [Tritonibacter scottomollicae]|uniref:Uncharacterized protein n=1 Tax=Tritonibacter scottomollicae TaxID=483013 RepID=A0A2T1AIN2_TRISK|nr:hypothetical protein [Tritonibacter scottomollicae]PRZ48433.1 hypothetical protein CLV89_104261 [Tritonibacter scottomollicae]
MKGWSVWMMLLLSGPALAAPDTVALTEFETCVAETFVSEQNNPFAKLGVPVICGERHIPIEQSCSLLKRLASPVDCLDADHAYWKGEFEAILTTEGVEEPAEPSLFRSGIERCAGTSEEGFALRGCEAEVYWRAVLIMWAIPVIEQVVAQGGD